MVGSKISIASPLGLNYLISINQSITSLWFLLLLFLKIIYFYYHMIIVLGGHCDGYKSTHNIAYLNSPFHQSPLFPLPPLLE
jgi:hypothetical protein